MLRLLTDFVSNYEDVEALSFCIYFFILFKIQSSSNKRQPVCVRSDFIYIYHQYIVKPDFYWRLCAWLFPHV